MEYLDCLHQFSVTLSCGTQSTYLHKNIHRHMYFNLAINLCHKLSCVQYAHLCSPASYNLRCHKHHFYVKLFIIYVRPHLLDASTHSWRIFVVLHENCPQPACIFINIKMPRQYGHATHCCCEINVTQWPSKQRHTAACGVNVLSCCFCAKQKCSN